MPPRKIAVSSLWTGRSSAPGHESTGQDKNRSAQKDLAAREVWLKQLDE